MERHEMVANHVFEFGQRKVRHGDRLVATSRERGTLLALQWARDAEPAPRTVPALERGFVAPELKPSAVEPDEGSQPLAETKDSEGDGEQTASGTPALDATAESDSSTPATTAGANTETAAQPAPRRRGRPPGSGSKRAAESTPA